MSVQDKQTQVVFSAKTPDGHEYKILSDGSCEGFPEGTIVANYWLAILNNERGNSIRK